MILLPHLDSFTSADTFNSRQVFVAVCLTVGVGWYNYLIFGSGTKLSVTDGNQSTQKRTTQAPRVPANTQQSPTRPAAGPRVHVEGNSSLLCVPPAMFPHLVQLSCKRQKKNGRLEELPPADGEQLELRESGRNTSILLIHQQEKSTYKCTCWVKHEGGTVEARTQQDYVPSMFEVKSIYMLYTVLIVKSLVYCCGLSLLMMLTNKGASTNCTHAD
ncbi:uncharacterized protein LOC112436434 [Maylandia zebra]|uniref:uncharacterized protein LOC112436434 n=1 Tax=Maylandia zebra TaxID=106582 RepID=UPI00403CE3DF